MRVLIQGLPRDTYLWQTIAAAQEQAQEARKNAKLEARAARFSAPGA